MNSFAYNRIKKDPLHAAVLKILEAEETKSPAVEGDVKDIPVRKGKAPVKTAAKDMEDETGSQRKLAADIEEGKEDLKDHPKYKMLTKKQFGKMKHWDRTDKPTDTKEESEKVDEVNYLNAATNSDKPNKPSKSPNFLKKGGSSSGGDKPTKDLTKEEQDRIEAKLPQLEEMVSRKHFQEVANTVRAIEDPKKRQEFANHHAHIFAGQNPRFDHVRFHAACGTRHEG